MRDSSYNFHTQTQQIFSRGGEKKVMKKSLSILLSFALVFGLFASMASAADTELTTAQKYQALVDKGVLKGNPDGDARLGNTLNRAEYATIAIAIAGLAEEKPATATFSDVNSKQWWYGAIEAAAKAGLVDGVGGGKFDPRSDVTIEQVIKVAVQAAGATPVEGAEVEGASAWAGPYIQAALDAGLIAAGLDYKASATRGQTIDVGYAVYDKLNPTVPAKVSVVSAKAAGVKKVAVSLDKAVDTEKATLTLKRNNTTIAAKATWSEDKKSATLELDSAKIIEGDYTVTLGGIAEDEIATASASFKAENEKVVKLEFTAPSDTLAQADKVKVQFQALNQYDEDVSIAAGSFSAYASTPGGANVQKDANGNLFVVIDTNDSTLIPNVSQISISVLNVESQITINKTFKLGSKPYVAKVELGKVVYSNGEEYLSKSGDKAVIELIQYDQYGHRITLESGSLFSASANVVPYLAELGTPTIVDDNNDQIEDVVVTLTGDAKVTGEYTVSVFGGSTASKVINVKSTQYAAKIELDSSVTLAAGDTGKYIGITAYDKEGNKLSAQDIVSNYKDGHIQFTSSANLGFATTASALLENQTGTSQYAVVKAGEHKGKLYIPNVGAKGMANIFVNITPSSANGILFNQNFTFNIQDKRYPVSLKVNTDNAKKAIPDASSAATSTLKVTAIDQYGESIKGTIGTIQESTRTVTYDVYVQTVASNPGVTLTGFGALGQHLDLSDVLDKDLTFTAAAAATSGDYTVKISLRKLASDGVTVIDDSVASVTKGMKIIPKDSRLTYSVKAIDTLFAAIDDPAMTGAADAVGTSLHARSVAIEAKDGSGDLVALPSDYVIGVSSADAKIVDTDSTRKIIGNKAGTTNLAITYRQADGGSSTVYKEVVVKADTISVASLSSNPSKSDTAANLSALNAAEIMNLKAKDNYNTEYGNTPNNILTYDKVLGIRYSLSDIQGVTVTVSPTGTVAVTGTGSFTLTASAPSGKTAVTAVVVQ